MINITVKHKTDSGIRPQDFEELSRYYDHIKVHKVDAKISLEINVL